MPICVVLFHRRAGLFHPAGDGPLLFFGQILQLRHGNVAQTFELGKVGEIYFIAMELVEGRNLREVLRRWLPAGADREPAVRTPHPGPGTIVSGGDGGVLDPQALDRIRALQRPGAPNILKKVITLFLAEAPKLFEALRDAVAQSDCAAMQRAAHICKSSSANLGALKFAGLCEEMEHDAHAGSNEQSQTRLGLIEVEYEKMLLAFQAQLSLP